MPRLRMLDTVNLRVVLHSSPMEKNKPGEAGRHRRWAQTRRSPTARNETGLEEEGSPQGLLLPSVPQIWGLRVSRFCVPHPSILSPLSSQSH